MARAAGAAAKKAGAATEAQKAAFRKKHKKKKTRRAPLETKATPVAPARIRSDTRRHLFGRRKPLEPR